MLKSMAFFDYFLGYIFRAKTRQRLLFMAIFGLMVSSAALVIIQGVMGGLQHGLIQRSKNVSGHYKVQIKESATFEQQQQLIDQIEQYQLPMSLGYEIELLLKKGEYLYPVILHAVDFKFFKPSFLRNKDTSGIVLGAGLASKLNAYLDSTVEIISPLHTTSILGEIPRYASAPVSDFFMSDITEIDGTTAWVRLGLVQNLIRQKRINSIRIYQEKLDSKLVSFLQNHSQAQLLSWESQNQTLVWALKLETSMMLFLFICMTLLVSVSITSGFMIFFDKVKVDLISFWILGKSQQELHQLTQRFTYLLSFMFTLFGVGLGVGVLLFLKYNEFKIFPSFFVEQRIPVHFSPVPIIIAFVVPFGVASIFSKFAFRFFKKENQSFVSLIRKVG